MAALRGPVDAISFSRGKRPMTDRGSGVLDVVRRPIAFCRFVVTLVEQRVEGLQNEPFVLFSCRLHERALLMQASLPDCARETSTP